MTVFKLKKKVMGGHTHIDVFAGKDEDHFACAGNLVFRNEEVSAFEAHFPELEPPRCKCESWYCGHSRDCPEYKEE